MYNFQLVEGGKTIREEILFYKLISPVYFL